LIPGFWSRAFLHTLTGEKVARVNREAGASRCEWDAKDKAGGLYLAAVAITDADGSWRRQFLKVLNIH
jgi:hypothetical protein